MLNLRKTKGELIQHQKIQDELVSRSRKILKAQADLLCQALQQLKRRSDAGQGTAGRIWDSLIDGITTEIPSQFFYNHSKHYFWGSGEKLSIDELAFRKLLDQAALKKNHSNDENNKRVTGTNNNELATVSVDVPGKLPVSSLLTVKPVEECREKSSEETDKLMSHLIDMLRVAVVKTELSLWDWKKEDTELKYEVGVFNKNLKVALNLFAEIHKCSDVTGLIDEIEKFSASDANKMFQMLNDAGAASIESSSYEYSDEEDEEESVENENDVFDSNATEVESDEDCKVPLPKKTGVKKEVNFTPSAPKLDIDGEGYIIRHARSKQAGKPLKSKIFRNPQCDHAGFHMPTSHYRDWKRDGFRCICGQKFRFLNAMDKHIFTQQEARMLACDKCDYKVNRKCCMDKHKKDNHKRPKMLRACRRLYQCMFGCDGVLKTKKELFDHQQKTGRQCKYKNALKLPVRHLPPNPLAFVEVLKRTCDKDHWILTMDRLDAILSAAEKDADNLKKRRQDKEKLIASGPISSF